MKHIIKMCLSGSRKAGMHSGRVFCGKVTVPRHKGSAEKRESWLSATGWGHHGVTWVTKEAHYEIFRYFCSTLGKTQTLRCASRRLSGSKTVNCWPDC